MSGPRALLLPLAVVLAPAMIAAQQPLFTARVEGVRVDALVTADGKPLSGLGPGDFEVSDNGVRQTIDLVSLGDVAVNVVLTLDSSSSVSGSKLTLLRRAGLSLLDALAPGDAAGLITFNTIVVQRVAPTSSLAAVRAALATAEGIGDTALVDAALGAMLAGDTDAARTLVMIFSDGVDTASFVPAARVLETARRLNGVVYGVSTVRDDVRFLRELTEATGGRLIELQEGGDPAAAFLEILQEFRRRYVITFTPAGVTAGGWHTLAVRVNRPRARVQARNGYFSSPK